VSLKFDIVVIGGGPAGLAAAYELSRRGFKTLVLERGRRPGSKNLYGGRIYMSSIEKICPELSKEIYKLGRRVVREVIMLTHGGTSLNIEIESNDWRGGVVTSLTRFVEWLAQKAEEAGACIVTSAKVDAIHVHGNRASGVRCGTDNILADVVVDAEGVNRILLEKAGLVPRLSPGDVALGVKEVYRVDPREIEKIFDLEEDTGLALLALGEVLDYLTGGCFMYVDKSHIHVGAVLYLSNYARFRRTFPEVLDRLYRLPMFRKVVKIGERVEYGARLLPVRPLPRAEMDGLVTIGDAGGYLVHIGPIIRGVDYAFVSGICAGRAIAELLEKERRPPSLASFRSAFNKYVRETSLMRDIELFKRVYTYYEAEDIYSRYVKFLVDFFREYLEVKNGVKSLNETLYMSMRKHGLSIWGLAMEYLRKFRKM